MIDALDDVPPHNPMIPTIAADPWDLRVLKNPLPLQEVVREAAPVVWLSSHDLYATGRYDVVHAALRDWQNFESGAGVGLMNKRRAAPWRPQSVLVEADPPHRDCRVRISGVQESFGSPANQPDASSRGRARSSATSTIMSSCPPTSLRRPTSTRMSRTSMR